MVLFNYALKELTAKIVYYGPGLSGKTTNLQYIYEELPIKNKGRMLTLATETDRTLYFDFLPVEAGVVRGIKTRIQLYTVPGQVFYNATRRMVLKGADGVVFVADSQRDLIEANLESMENLRENLRAHDLDLEEIPHVIQYNKRDLPDVMPIEELNEQINTTNVPFYEAVASQGIGVEDTLKAVSSLVMSSVIEKYGGARANRLASLGRGAAERRDQSTLEKTDPFAVRNHVGAVVGSSRAEASASRGSVRRGSVTAPVNPRATSAGSEDASRVGGAETSDSNAGEDMSDKGPLESLDGLNLEGILDEALKIDDGENASEGLGGLGPHEEEESPPAESTGSTGDDELFSTVLEDALGLNEEAPQEASPRHPDGGPEISFGEETGMPEGLLGDERTDRAVTAGRLHDLAKTQVSHPIVGPGWSRKELQPSAHTEPRAMTPGAAIDVSVSSDGEPCRVVVPVRVSFEPGTDEAELEIVLKVRLRRNERS